MYTGTYLNLSKALSLPYTVTRDSFVVISLIAYPKLISPFGITRIGNSLLGESIVTSAETLLGTISTFTESPFLSYAFKGISFNFTVPSSCEIRFSISTNALTVETSFKRCSAPLITLS